MAGEWRRGAKEGVAFGIIAGVVFAIAEMAGAAIMGNPALMPIRMFASVVLGRAAIETTPLGMAVLVGVAAHLVLSAVFGLIYGLVASRLPHEAQTRWGRQAAMGLLFGVGLWFVNFQLIARLAYPWFLTTPQLLQVGLHAVFYGLPLGLLYAGAERRLRLVRPAPPAPAAA